MALYPGRIEVLPFTSLEARAPPRCGSKRPFLMILMVGGILMIEIIPMPLSVVRGRLVKNRELEGTVPFQPEYPAGHTATRYDRDPASAFEEVRRWAEEKRTPKEVRNHIGGDRTNVRSALTGYSDVRFALIVAPLWVLTYIADGKTWQVLVDGRTGEVAGQFPVDGGKLARLLLTWLGSSPWPSSGSQRSCTSSTADARPSATPRQAV